MSEVSAGLAQCREMRRVNMQGGGYCGATARQRKKGRETCIQIGRNMGHDVENPAQTSSILPFIKICSLNSCSQRTSSLHRHHGGQQTVCPPNADSSPGKVLLNHGTQRQTGGHKTVYAKEGGGAVARNKWYNAPRGAPPHSVPWNNGPFNLLYKQSSKKSL